MDFQQTRQAEYGRILEGLPYTTLLPEEGNGGDDCADALRYLVATRPPEVVVRKLVGL
jgi:hypothetical protein